jgi:ribonuclease P protein component
VLKTTLGKNTRLLSTRHFQNVFENARKFRYHGASVLVHENELIHSRLGICIPKKQIPRAVDRNRIKRLIRENFRLRRTDLINHLDMIFLGYAALQDLDNKEITVCLDSLWAKLIKFYKKA